jgi:predicted double-glycine peptidase
MVAARLSSALVAGLIAGTLAAPSGSGKAAENGQSITARPKSYLDMKYQYTVRQRRDFTCGAAALATMLKFHYDMPVTEEMLFFMIASRYKPTEFRAKAEAGFSFEDLIFVSSQLGFNSQAAIVPLGELTKLNGPIIIKIDWREIDHFVVLRKKTADLAYVSDPLVGDIAFNNSEFESAFKGEALAVWPSYITEDYFSGLSVIRDPISVHQSLTPLQIKPTTFAAQRPF